MACQRSNPAVTQPERRRQHSQPIRPRNCRCRLDSGLHVSTRLLTKVSDVGLAGRGDNDNLTYQPVYSTRRQLSQKCWKAFRLGPGIDNHRKHISEKPCFDVSVNMFLLCSDYPDN